MSMKKMVSFFASWFSKELIIKLNYERVLM